MNSPDNQSDETPPKEADDPGAIWFVIGTWLLLTVMALGFVTVYGNRTPRWEDWFFVPVITGSQPVDFAWLWENVQGHRLPIQKLIATACYSVFGFNSKPILYLNVALFSALALGLLWAIRRVRGRWQYADAFLPVVLLNLGQAEAFSWAMILGYVILTCVEATLLIVIVTHKRALNPLSLFAAGACLVVLPLTFGGGVVFAAVMIPWLVYQGFGTVRPRPPARVRARLITVCLAGIAVITIGVYFLGYQPHRAAPAERYVEPSLRAYALTAVKFLGTSFGGAASHPLWQLPAILITAILIFTAFCLGRVLVRKRITGDPQALGLGFFLVSCLAVAWVVGMGRYSWGDTVLDSRYAAMSVVTLLAAYFICEFFSPARLLPLARMLLFSSALSFLAANLQLGVRQGQMLRDAERAFLKDLRAAEPIFKLVAHHSWVTYYDHQRLENYLRQLRDAGVAPYDRLPPDPSFGVRALDSKPAQINAIAWNGNGGQVLGHGAYLRYDLKEPVLVAGLRFRFSLVDPSGMLPAMGVRWAKANGSGVRHYNCRYNSTTGDEAEIVLYIDDRISQIWILPNNRQSSFRISGIELLLPEAERKPDPAPAWGRLN